MTFSIILLQITLGIILFFLINWIGKHSYSLGYMQISIFVRVEEAPALNFLIRILSPIIYIIICSSVLYYFQLDKFVQHFYLVNIYYIVFRLAFNLITNRGLLINWYRQALNWAAIILLSYFVYSKIIAVKANLLPDFTSLNNELWIIIIVFLFHVTNNIRLSQDGTVRRKQNYLRKRYLYFKKLYGKKISEITNGGALEFISYAIIIYEDFNRPKIVRLAETLSFRIRKEPHTLGVMQVYTDKAISDFESVIKGVNKIKEAYNTYIEKNSINKENFQNFAAYWHIISDYNKGQGYVYEIQELTDILVEAFYCKTPEAPQPLFPIEMMES